MFHCKAKKKKENVIYLFFGQSLPHRTPPRMQLDALFASSPPTFPTSILKNSGNLPPSILKTSNNLSSSATNLPPPTTVPPSSPPTSSGLPSSPPLEIVGRATPTVQETPTQDTQAAQAQSLTTQDTQAQDAEVKTQETQETQVKRGSQEAQGTQGAAQGTQSATQGTQDGSAHDDVDPFGGDAVPTTFPVDSLPAKKRVSNTLRTLHIFLLFIMRTK